MSENIRHAIVVGPQELYQFFSSYYTQWEWQHPITTINEMWNQSENGQLNEETDVFVIYDELYKSDPEGFVDTLLSLAQADNLVFVLQYDPQIRDAVSNAILTHPTNDAYRREHGHSLEPIFLNHETALVQMDDAVQAYDTKDSTLESFYRENPVEVDVTRHSDHHAFNRSGKIITVTSNKGGSGKSTVSLLVASGLALGSQQAYEAGLTPEPLRVCVVDLDTFDSQLGFVLNQDKPTALNIALSTEVVDEEFIYNNLIYSENMGFHTLLATRRGHTAIYTNAEFYSRILGMLRGMFDVIILDTSVQHYDDLLKTVALPIADAILLVTTLDMKSVGGLTRWLDTARRPLGQSGHGVDMDKIGIVVNQSIRNVGMGQEQLKAAAQGTEILVNIPLDTKAVLASGNAGRLEEVLKSHIGISAAYQKLVNDLAVNVLGNPPIGKLLDASVEEAHNLQHGGHAGVGSSTANAKAKKKGLFRKKN